jgi:hypothetical protein
MQGRRTHLQSSYSRTATSLTRRRLPCAESRRKSGPPSSRPQQASAPQGRLSKMFAS